MRGMTLLSREEMAKTVGGACPYTKEYIQQHVKELLDAGKKEAAAEFIRMVYELGCR